MAISFIGSAVNSSSPNVGTTVTLPGGMAVNDLIIVAAGVGDTANNGMVEPTTGGYTRIGAATIYADDVNDTNLDLYYKYHNGTDTTVAFTGVGGTNASNAAVVMVFRGVALAAQGGPFDTAVSTASGINTSNADPPSHDWSGAAGVWTVIAASTGHTGTATATFTFPTGYTTNAAQRAHNDTIDVLVGMGYKTNPADPENPAAFTAANIGTAADNAWAAVTMSLKEAVPTVFERAVAIDAAIQIATIGTFFSVFDRAVAIDAAINIAVSGVVEPGGPAIFERTVAIDALISLAALGQRDLPRSAAIDAAVLIAVTGSRVVPIFERATRGIVSVAGLRGLQGKPRRLKRAHLHGAVLHEHECTDDSHYHRSLPGPAVPAEGYYTDFKEG